MSTTTRAQRYLRNAILLLATVGAVYFVGREVLAARGNASTDAPLPPSAKVVVYYFSTGKECSTCEQIPLYARAALDASFEKELADGVVVWRAYDVDEPAFEHFVSDFGLYTKSIVLVRMERGAQVRWKNLDKVWDLVGEREAFVNYVRDEVREMLEAAA